MWLTITFCFGCGDTKLRRKWYEVIRSWERNSYETSLDRVFLLSWYEVATELIRSCDQTHTKSAPRASRDLFFVFAENKISYNDNDYILAFIYDEKKMHELLSGYGFVQEPYEKNTYLLVKYGLGSRVEAEEFVDLIMQNKKILSNDKYFVLSTSQYINMLIFKTLEINKN